MWQRSETIGKLLTLLLILVLVLVGCTSGPGQSESPTAEPVGEPKPDNLTEPPFAIPVRGDYDEELSAIQQELSEQHLLHGEVIHNATALRDLVARYGLRPLQPGQSLVYNDIFFEENALIMVYGQQGSSSLRYVFGQAQDTGFLIDITLLRIDPKIGTTDMVLHGFLVGISREVLHDDTGQIKPLNITEWAVPAAPTEEGAPLTHEDLMLGNLRLFMTPLEAEFALNRPPDRVEEEQDGLVRRLYYDQEQVEIIIDENDAVVINTASPVFATPRGLQVGNSRQDLIRLYGEPSEAKEVDNGNLWLSYSIDGELLAFHAETRDDTIVRLEINLGREQL